MENLILTLPNVEIPFDRIAVHCKLTVRYGKEHGIAPYRWSRIHDGTLITAYIRLEEVEETEGLAISYQWISILQEDSP